MEMCKEARKNGQEMIYRNAPAMVAVAIDTEKATLGCEYADPFIALSYLDLYAPSLGLGTLWCDIAGMMAEQIPEVYAMLEIPENYTLRFIMLLGIPAVKYQRTIRPEQFGISEVR